MTAPLRLTTGWATAALIAVGVVALAASPALLGFEGGALVREAFAPFCHQMPSRSPHLHGASFALCHRCFGIVSGLALGVLAGPLLGARLGRLANLPPLAVLGVAALPTSADWLLGATGVWANTGASRLATGAVFGVAAGLLLAAAFCAPRPSLTPASP